LQAMAQLPESEPLRCVFHRSYAERQQPRNPSPPAHPQNTAVSPETISASKGVNASLDDPFAQPPPTTPRILLGADEPETDSPPASPRLPGLFVAGQLAVPASPATPSTPPLDPHIRRQDEPSPPSSPELELRTPGGSSTQATSPLLHHKSSSVFGWGSASIIDPVSKLSLVLQPEAVLTSPRSAAYGVARCRSRCATTWRSWCTTSLRRWARSRRFASQA